MAECEKCVKSDESKIKKIVAASIAAKVAISGIGNAYSDFGYTVFPKATNVIVPLPKEHYKDKKRSKKKRARRRHR